MKKAISAPNDDGGDKSEVWNRLLRTALAMPGARIDRTTFLRKELSKHFPEDVVEKAIQTRPAAAGVPNSAIRSIAMSSIAWHRAGVSAVSFVTGLPGGWWMAGTMPADLTQFFWHVVVILQKLAYLYGWPSLADKDQELDDETLLLFTIFVGVMFGAGTAAKALGELSEKVAGQVLKRLPKAALTKWGIYRLAREVAKWIGVKLTKETFVKWLSKAIPVFSGFLSGGITWLSFSGMSKRLRNHLEKLRLSRPDNDEQGGETIDPPLGAPVS
jgi:hypothetical protein